MHPASNRSTWTFEDLQALPEDPLWRYEIVDGGLVMTPGPNTRHEWVSAVLRGRMQKQLPDGFCVLGPLSVDLHPSYRVPDLVVISEDLVRAEPLNEKLRPVDVQLVVEVVSPSSLTTDRITKPAQYAAAGIAHFWRIEPGPDVSLSCYELRAGDSVYTEVGTWTRGETARVERPFPLAIDLDDLAL